jgi:hypothetical protein
MCKERKRRRKFDEAESVLAGYLGGDLNNEKRIWSLNKSHFEAMEILKSIERSSEEQFKFDLLENEAVVDDALHHDLKMYECFLILWDLNEHDRSMWIGVYDDGTRYARFGKWRFGEVDME